MNPEIHLALLIILIVLYIIWFIIILKKPRPKKTTWLTVNDINMFRKGEKIEILGTNSPENKATVQKFKILRLFPKKNKIKVKKIT